MQNHGLFATVPEDRLHFGIGSNFAPKQVVDLLELKNKEVARIAAVSVSSVRYDNLIPQAVRDLLQDIASICNMVAGIFDGDQAKTALWFKTVNPLLGDIAPRDMVRLGRYDRLRKFIITAISENSPPPQKSVAKKSPANG